MQTNHTFSGPIKHHVDGDLSSVPLVLLHGFCEDHSVWNDWMREHAQLAIICIDLPGFGESALPPSSDMVHYVHAVRSVLDRHNVKRCVLYGHSLGGYAALEFAAEHPERLAGLGLFHSHPYVDSKETRQKRKRAIEMLHAGKKAAYLKQLIPSLFSAKFAETNPAVIENALAMANRQTAAGITAALEIMLDRRDHTRTLRELNVPVQILQGEEDKVVPMAWAESAAKLPTSVDFVKLPNVAHMGMLEAPNETASLVRTFWATCASRRSHGSIEDLAIANR